MPAEASNFEMQSLNLLTTEVRRILRRYTCNASTDAYGFRAIVLVELQKMFTKVHVEVRTVALHIGRILSLHIGQKLYNSHTHTFIAFQ